MVVSLLSIRVSDEQCVMIMSVRKGKRLISRLLPFLPQAQAAAVVMAIARKLPALAKKDKQDQVNISGCYMWCCSCFSNHYHHIDSLTIPVLLHFLHHTSYLEYFMHTFLGFLDQQLSLCCAQVLCWLVEPVSAVIQSLSSSALTDLLQELQGSEGQLATVLHNKVHTQTMQKLN